MIDPEFAPIETFLPHREPALLLDRVLERTSEHTVASVDVASQTWLKRDDGSVAPWVAIEYMAQCIAAHEGLEARREGRPPAIGFLVAVNRVQLHASRIEPDAVLRVRTRRLRGRPGIGAISHSCSVHTDGHGRDGTLIAEARLTISIGDRPPIGAGSEAPPST